MMNRILKRPMFRMGGRSDDGIMSMRPGFQPGGIVPGSILTTGGGVMPPGSGTTPSPISTVQRFFPPTVIEPAGVPATTPTGGSLTTTGGTTAPTDRMFRLGQKVKGGFRGLMSLLTGPAAKTAGGTALSTAPLLATIGGLSYMNYPVYPKGHPKEGEFVSKEEAVDIFDKAGEAGTAADIAGEAAMFDLEPGEGQDEYGNFKYPTKFNFKDPEVVEISNKLNLFPDQSDTPSPPKKDPPIDDGLGDDGTSDFEKSLNEYLPAIESALEIDDEATKRQLFLQLAKFGAGLVAQPGGDLTGAIGRAALDPIEGVGKVLSDKQAAKRQAKLIAVQAAIKDMGPGSYGKNVQDIMKTFNLKGKEGRKQAGAIYNKILSNDSTALSRDRDDLSDTARNDLRLKGGAIDAYVSNIRALRQSDPELIGKFNKIITSEDKPTDKEYYVTEEGEFVRYDKKTDQFLQPGDDGFSDSKKKKK
jgi:hypothetical protein